MYVIKVFVKGSLHSIDWVDAPLFCERLYSYSKALSDGSVLCVSDPVGENMFRKEGKDWIRLSAMPLAISC